MKYLAVLAVLAIAAGLTSGVCYKCNRYRQIIDSYRDYYKATEELLDTLEQRYNWVDGYDPYDYYEAVDNLLD